MKLDDQAQTPTIEDLCKAMLRVEELTERRRLRWTRYVSERVEVGFVVDFQARTLIIQLGRHVFEWWHGPAKIAIRRLR